MRLRECNAEHMKGSKTSQRELFQHFQGLRENDENFYWPTVKGERGRQTPEEYARTVVLSRERQQFRASRAARVLDLALPLDVWQQGHFWLRHGQKKWPVAKRFSERWYRADQIEG